MCIAANCFDEIWVNSEHDDFGAIADWKDVYFHNRSQSLGNNQSTSQQYIAEFLEKHDCANILQVHSIAPLLTVDDILSFVDYMETSDYDCLLSTEEIQIECAFQNHPINFAYLPM